MIDMLYNLRVGDINAAEFSDEFNKLCIPFENSLSEDQIDVFHKILDCVSDTAAAEMRATYKIGFKGGVALMNERKHNHLLFCKVLSLMIRDRTFGL